MRFEKAIDFTRQWEGWISNDPDDPGGITKYGISLRFLRGVDKSLGDVDGDGDVDENDIKALTWEQAEALYKKEFWDALDLDYTPSIAAIALFDTAVNMGRNRAVKILQESINTYLYKVDVDGDYGPQTKEALRQLLTHGNPSFGDRFCIYRLKHYQQIIAAKKKLAKFFCGWTNRTIALSDAIRCEVW